jgi:hypothetical protein
MHLTMMAQRKPMGNLTAEQRQSVISHLMERGTFIAGQFRLAPGAAKDTAIFFGVNRSTVNRIWRRALENRRSSVAAYVAPSAIKENSGRPLLYDRAALNEELAELPYCARKNMRSVAACLGVSLGTVWRLINVDKVINPHTNALRPYLTEANQQTRLMYAADEVERPSPTGGWYFKAGFDVVHLDEKWFFLTEKQLHVYLAEGEEAANRSVIHGSHILKVMFLVALARPRFDKETGECTFDGKIGCWPFAVRKPAVRASVNRPRGTMETKPVNVDSKAYMRMVRNKVIPAIKAKFPQEPGPRIKTVIRLQHDNATSHFQWFDPDFMDIWSENRQLWDFQVKEQPPNSPDCNVLDLGFFRALQSLQWQQEPATTIDGLIENVGLAFNEYDPILINRVFLSHQQCMNCILEHNGDNNYKLPHMGKEQLERHGELPLQLLLSPEALDAIIFFKDIT